MTRLQYGTVDPGTPDGATTWLSHSGSDLFTSVATQDVRFDRRAAPPWLEASFTIIDGLLTSDGLPSKVARSRKRGSKPLIPGSTWKGIIRSRAEYIVRSRYGEQAACQQLDGCGTCVTCEIFGHQGQRSKLAFRDSYLEGVPDAPPVRTQVAIDRVSGGARDSLLFQTQPLTAGQLNLRIDELDDVAPWTRNLIWHVLRDIDDGLIGVGSRTTRGLGTLRLTSPSEELQPVRVPALEDSVPAEAAQ